MATLLKMHQIYQEDNNLRNRVTVAVVKHAQYLKALPTPTQAQTDWANAALASPAQKAVNVLWEVVVNPTVADAVNTDGVTDAQLQTIVDAVCERY